MRTDLCRIGWALTEYRAAEGHFPESLAELRDRFPGNIPTDLYSGKPLKYRLVEGGFLLYSIGPNGTDDGGQTLGERPGAPNDWDDIRFGIDPPRPDPPADQ